MKKFLIHISIFGIFLLVLVFGFTYLYEGQIRAAKANGDFPLQNKWNGVKQAEQYDILILGSSRGYCSFNPEVLDATTGLSSYNMCTGSQNMVESKYVLDELLTTQSPKVVVIDLFLPSLTKGDNFYQIMANADYMDNYSTQMVVKGFGLKGAVNYVLPILRHKQYIKKDVLKLVEGKWKPRVAHEGNWSKGYLSDSSVVAQDAIEHFEPVPSLVSHPVDDGTLKYLEALLETCKNNNITVIPVSSPFPDVRLTNEEQIKSRNHFLDSICKDHGVLFYNMNEEEGSYDTDLFVDSRHMNTTGATRASEELGKYILRVLKQ